VPKLPQGFDADASYAGKRVLCPHCQSDVSVPNSEGTFKKGSPPLTLGNYWIRALIGVGLVAVVVAGLQSTFGAFLTPTGEPDAAVLPD
jgi:hypothetical protein